MEIPIIILKSRAQTRFLSLPLDVYKRQVSCYLGLLPNPQFCGKREGIPHLDEMDLESRAALIRENPAYGNIICRCEMISEGEIIDAIHRPLGARSLDGVKRRTRAGMGRCQACLLYTSQGR